MSAAMEKTLFNMKFTAKQLEREAKKMERKQAENDQKALASMNKQDIEKAKIFASEAMRNKNMSTQYTRIAARIEAVAGRVEAAIRMKTFAKSMGVVTHDMESVLSSMDPVKINAMMDKFEKQFENLDVGVASMDESVSRAMAGVTPEAEVSDYMRQLQARSALTAGEGFAAVPMGGVAMGAGAAVVGPQPVATAVGPAAGGASGGAAGGGLPPPPPGAGSGGGGGGGDAAAALQARLNALRGK